MLRRIIAAFGHLPGVGSSALTNAMGELAAGSAEAAGHSALVSSGERAARELGLGVLEEAWAESIGAVILAPIGESETLRLRLDNCNSIGRASHEVRRTKSMIEELLR
jgi:predicted regulator of Ras-like GTPase activity (Roadblock/LC7/MglB family)